MKEHIKGVIISLIISFTIPTLVVASKWGAYEANLEQVMMKLDKIEKKVDKVDDKVNYTREDVAKLKGKLSQ